MPPCDITACYVQTLAAGNGYAAAAVVEPHNAIHGVEPAAAVLGVGLLLVKAGQYPAAAEGHGRIAVNKEYPGVFYAHALRVAAVFFVDIFLGIADWKIEKVENYQHQEHQRYSENRRINQPVFIYGDGYCLFHLACQLF